MTKAVAILGCGPAGLLVAHAANISGWAFTVYSKRQKSILHGAQYLHEPIPKLDAGYPQVIEYKLRGTAEQYRHKVYGRFWEGSVSPEDLADSHPGWDLRAAYAHLWNMYEAEIIDTNITPNDRFVHMPTYGVIDPLKRYDLVISTVPRKIWAEEGDIFNSQKIWAMGDGPHNSQDDFTVICDGTHDVEWYRSAKIFGHSTIEWPYHELWEKPPHHGAVIVEKPLWHNSKAASDIVHLGRYGAWEKGVLTSDAFYKAITTLAEDSIDG